MKKIKNLLLIWSILLGTVFYACAAPKMIPHANTVLVFAPHPDDDVLGCGGAIIQHAQSGARIIIVYMTSGEAAYWSEGREKLAQLREEEARKAAEKLGVSELIYLRKPDARLSSSRLETVEHVTELLSQTVPDVVYIPHKDDGHADHRAAHYIVVEAIKASLHTVDSLKETLVLGYEVWTPLQKVTHLADISKEIDTKMDAMSEHKTQIAYINYIDAIKGLNKYRGIMNHSDSYAECFQKIDIL